MISLAVWRREHPLWLCAFRPFFALTMISAWLWMALWGAFIFMGMPVPRVPGGPFVWHAHALLLGMGMAALAGFILTSVPEFTKTAAFEAAPVRLMVLLWLGGRLAFRLSPALVQPALLVAAACDLGLLAVLLRLTAPRLWQDPDRRHLSFLWALLVLAVLTAGFYGALLLGHAPERWLFALVGFFMVLIVLALSRVSTAMLNESIDLLALSDGPDAPERDPYIARPPRRNLAVFCIVAYTAAEWLGLDPAICGWLALASACAVLGLLADWHVGRPLLRRWPLMLYAVYVFMATGYALAGLAKLGLPLSPNAGLHALTTGALGLNIYLVICIAGYTHSGLDKDGRPWVIVGGVLLMASALARLAAYFGLPESGMALAAILWCAAFGLQTACMLPVFMRSRSDGLAGCAERVA